MPFKLFCAALGLALAAHAEAATLSEVYREALAADAPYASARAAYRAALEKLPQGRAGLLPTVNLGANLRWNDVNSSLPGGDSQFSSNGLALSAAQPVFRQQNRLQYDEAKNQVRIAELQLKAAEQDLILRTARAYFDVLQSRDNIAFIQAQKAAIAEQLAAARRNFEVGTATITDTHEAQARFDLASAQEIAEQNTLEIRLRVLEKIIGKPADTLAPLDARAPLGVPEPHSIDDWAGRAANGNLQAAIQRIAREIADQEVARNRAGHYPTLDAVASYNVNNNQNLGALKVDTRTAVLGLEFNLPIYQGGLTSARVREAVANQDKSRADVDNALREANLAARSAFLNATSGEAQVRALEQALRSSQTQLASTRLGVEVGVRTSLDLLNAEQQVLSAQRDLAAARYRLILATLELKAAAGTLGADDLADIDRHLTPAKAK